jgi:[acyl-carrier-protein] S-malonyltransferase
LARPAFLFPGQGSQHAGMGAALLADDEIASLADACSKAAGIDLRYLLVDAPDAELTLTTNAQPALLFAGVALARLMAREGVTPAALAGHSVGEYTALCVAGAIGVEDAVRAVVERGRAMSEASPPGVSSMAAVLGAPVHAVERALEGEGDVWLANYNTPTQTVIAGTVPALQRVEPALREAGARRVLGLNVAAAFHTPLMKPAGARLRRVLDGMEWRAPAVPVIANVDAQPYEGEPAIADGLERQLSAPVRWSSCVATLRELGCDAAVELGPKRALSGMMRELAPDVPTTPVSTPEAVRAFAAGDC